uniref:O-acyltransferase n=1 Tax=Albugo laibachii Nc14 TaxID=890382 RepID=F0WG29_9STRA|nr:sterol Oacyltransferase putative [Albugo laibachii Nc14]|eukprot:CCA20163.1 sterol Oacyltransferase putative [Albugo laibachii Nc14]
MENAVHQTSKIASKAPTTSLCDVSPLDLADARSSIHNSDFLGMYNLCIICGALYLLNTLISTLWSVQNAFDPSLFQTVFCSYEFVDVVMVLILQCVFSFTAMIPVYLANASWSRDSRLLTNVIHHVLQSIFLFGNMTYLIYRDWHIIHIMIVFIECLVLLMKMHSYTRVQIQSARSSETNRQRQSFRSFCLFLLFPTLVYQSQFPRTLAIRPWYLMEKLIALTLSFAMFYVIVTNHVIPILNDSGVNDPVLVISNLLLPFIGCYLMTWFIIFECICNIAAEISMYAKRDFYGDWWNSTTFEEFARKWNRPVHEFLFHHVYLEGRKSFQMSRTSAMFLTFFLSAAVHECCFIVVFRALRMYHFVIHMSEIGCIACGNGLKGTRVGNYFYWLAMAFGLPLQAVLYCREYHGGEPIFLHILMPMMVGSCCFLAVISIFYVSKVRIM